MVFMKGGLPVGGSSFVVLLNNRTLNICTLMRRPLRNNKDLLERYSESKKSLTDNPNITREEYAARKTDFIVSVLSTAGFDERTLRI